ncbi:vWA domain-containing protein [Dongia sp.]|uniref:vWA domain-containing protein n=1 Tax=Dongia sp. TaxID=1977262 RepID=UPI0035B06974
MNVETNLGSGTVTSGVLDEADIVGAALTQSTGPVVEIQVPTGENVVRVLVTANETVQLPFPADDLAARLNAENGNLSIKSGDLTIILQGYADASAAGPVEIIGSDGEPVDVAATIATTDPNIDIQTAAGPAAGDAGNSPENNGGVFSPFEPDAGIGGLTAVGGLEATALNYTVIQRNVTFYDPQDDLTPLAAEDGEDTSPINYNDANSGTENSYRDTNVMIVLDISGSMNEDADVATGGVQSRISIAKAALSNLLHTYETLGDVRATVVVFNKTASILFNWGSVSEAIAAIEAIIIDPKALTNYDAALEAAETAWENPGKLTGDVDNVIYFLSDGKPTWGGGWGNHLSDTDIATWDAFLEDPANGINHVYAVGIGNDIVPPEHDLTDVANPDGDNLPAGDVLYVTDPLDLGPALVGTVEGDPISGNVLSGADTSGIGDNGLPGDADTAGDGATHIYTFSYDSADDGFDVSFSWDGSAASVTQDNVGGSNVSISGREVSFDTESGRMTFDFDTGDYTFTPGGISEDTDVTFHYGTRDADGDVDLPGGADGDAAPGGADLVITITNIEPEIEIASVESVDSLAAPASVPGDEEAALLAAN